ncbi:MAG: transpeptidase family protein [Spirochaetaceae bacterium]|jgi:cell division protein FtsI (penicillin-binding protein 3)|nr:transpeptidase family protein [Spirochaetaceae bacterium]
MAMPWFNVSVRFKVIFLIIGFYTVTLLVRYGQVMLFSDLYLTESLETGLPSVFIDRGPILDRNGRILATQEDLAHIGVNPPDFIDYPERTATLAQLLSPILKKSEAELIGLMTDPVRSFVYLKKGVDSTAMKEFNKIKEQGILNLVRVDQIKQRIYPEGSLASQILGFVNSEYHGGEGIESSLDSIIAPGGNNKGNQVILTIDTNIQYILEKIAAQVMVENKAEQVMFMAMDPRSGEILGAASLPHFDPNNFNAFNPATWLYKPAVDAYEPGSVFKILSLASLLDSGVITGNTVFNCDGRYERITGRGEKIIINCLAAHGKVTVREIIQYSCNAGAAYAADHITNTAFHTRLKDLGFGAQTFVGNPGESLGILKTPEQWSERSKPTIAMGQEISVSAMQILHAATAIANDGLLVPLSIIKETRTVDGTTIKLPYQPEPSRQVLKPQTAQAMRRYMVDVTSTAGTGWRAYLDDMSMAVKTGTAQIVDEKTGAYSSKDYIASCIAMLPADNPSLVLYLVIVKPREGYLGGRIAAPPIGQAANELVDYLGIPRGRNQHISHSGTITIPSNPLPILDSKMPNLIGYSKRQLLPFLFRDDLTIEIIGDGWVKRQSLKAGATLSPGDTIVVELE